MWHEEIVDAVTLRDLLQGPPGVVSGADGRVLRLDSQGAVWELSGGEYWFKDGMVELHGGTLYIHDASLHVGILFMTGKGGQAASGPTLLLRNATIRVDAAITYENTTIDMADAIIEAGNPSFPFAMRLGPMPSSRLVATNSKILGFGKLDLQMVDTPHGLILDGDSVRLLVSNATIDWTETFVRTQSVIVTPMISGRGSGTPPIPKSFKFPVLNMTTDDMEISPDTPMHVTLSPDSLARASPIPKHAILRGWVEVEAPIEPEIYLESCILCGGFQPGTIVWGNSLAESCPAGVGPLINAGAGHMLEIVPPQLPFGPFTDYYAVITAHVANTNVNLTQVAGYAFGVPFHLPILESICLPNDETATLVDSYDLFLAMNSRTYGCARFDPSALSVSPTLVPYAGGGQPVMNVTCTAQTTIPPTT